MVEHTTRRNKPRGEPPSVDPHLYSWKVFMTVPEKQPFRNSIQTNFQNQQHEIFHYAASTNSLHVLSNNCKDKETVVKIFVIHFSCMFYPNKASKHLLEMTAFKKYLLQYSIQQILRFDLCIFHQHQNYFQLLCWWLARSIR